jgi:hypothetical protein
MLDRRDNLTREEFVARATFDADFAECFGLFDYFYRKILQPIEQRVRTVLVCEVESVYYTHPLNPRTYRHFVK